MAVDRFVYWQDERPTRQDLQWVIEDFFGDAAVSTVWSGDRFYVTLRGRASNPLTRLRGTPMMVDRERWIEVWIGEDEIDIITRMADLYTSVVTDGLYRFIRFYYSALGNSEEQGE